MFHYFYVYYVIYCHSFIDTDDTSEARALYDYTARSPKEISFSKGDKIKIFTKTTCDWWDAKVDGKYGYVPVSYIKILETRPSSVSESDVETKREVKKGTDRNEPSLHVEKKHHNFPSIEGDISPTGPLPDESKKPSDLKALSDSEGDHCGNVFAAIDPTCTTVATSPGIVKRGGSERNTGGLKTHPPVRTQSDKRDVGPHVQKYHNITEEDSGSEELPLTFAAGKQTVGPPVGGKSIFLVSQQDLQTNKLRSPSESFDDRPLVSPTNPGESQTIGRPSIKDKSRAYSQPILERPLSQLNRPILGHIQIESADRPSPIPNFKPPPPPPALKPKPSTKKKDVPSQLAAGAAAIVKNRNDGRDVTHL